MNGKLKLLIGLLVVGLAAIGVGVWVVAKSPPEIVVPEGEPVVFELVDRVGSASTLYIYADGSVLRIEDTGLRVQSPHNPPTRTWRTGKLTAEQLDDLLVYLENSGLDGLQDTYQYAGEPLEGGGTIVGDMLVFSVKSQNLGKSVTARGYLSPDNGETYPGMPAPLNEIYVKLKAILLETREVYRENL